jgi:hypothetical protein
MAHVSWFVQGILDYPYWLMSFDYGLWTHYSRRRQCRILKEQSGIGAEEAREAQEEPDAVARPEQRALCADNDASSAQSLPHDLIENGGRVNVARTA